MLQFKVQEPTNHNMQSVMQGKRNDNMTTAKICTALEADNMERVLNSLPKKTFNILLSNLRKYCILENEVYYKIKREKDQIMQVEGLVIHLDKCSEDQYERLIELMQFKEETFVLGYHMAAMYKYCCGEPPVQHGQSSGGLQLG